MSDQTMTERPALLVDREQLVQHWVSVTDAAGRTHLEARWVVESPHEPPVAAPSHSHAA